MAWSVIGLGLGGSESSGLAVDPFREPHVLGWAVPL
jgi:hypothetical protein